MPAPTYVRIQARYRGRLGVEVGVFVAVDHLRRAGRLSAAQEAQYLDIDDWFNQHLPNPDFYADGNTVGAVTWFKLPIPDTVAERVRALCAILDDHDVSNNTVTSDDPGTLIYADDMQVGVVPYRREAPSQMPEDVALTPTSAGSKRSVAASPIRHVLFDADGVLQELPGGWHRAMEPYLGARTDEFLRHTWREELGPLAGDGDYLPMLAATLAEYGVSEPVEEGFAAVWHRIEVDADSMRIAQALRRNGYGVHLGSNQEQHRAAYMRNDLGYDAFFDVSCYSYDLGFAKPAPEFFAEAARRIGADPGTIVFIDDVAENVEAAIEAGLAGIAWDHGQGHGLLVDTLANLGVDARLTL